MKVKISSKKLLYLALAVVAFLILSAFIPIYSDSGFNYIVVDSLLGIIIFHNLYILATIIFCLAIALAKSISYKSS